MTTSQLTHPFSLRWTFEFFPFWLVKEVAITLPKHVFWWTYALISDGHTCESGTAKSRFRCMCSISRNCLTVSQSTWTIFCSHQLHMRTSVTTHLHQYSTLTVSQTILRHVWWYLTVALICIFLITKDVEPFFICVLKICISSFMKSCI